MNKKIQEEMTEVEWNNFRFATAISLDYKALKRYFVVIMEMRKQQGKGLPNKEEVLCNIEAVKGRWISSSTAGSDGHLVGKDTMKGDYD